MSLLLCNVQYNSQGAHSRLKYASGLSAAVHREPVVLVQCMRVGVGWGGCMCTVYEGGGVHVYSV